MIARRSVWTHPEVIDLVSQFVPAADEVSRLQSGTDAECQLFQAIAEQGHYAGRTRPSRTRQGIYAMTPDGLFLASINSIHADKVAAMLRQALDSWNGTEKMDRSSIASESKAPPRDEELYPSDGLVLAVFSRDLVRVELNQKASEPREKADHQDDGENSSDWRSHAWNRDYAWFRQAEAMSFVPEELSVGAWREVPRELVSRIARLHLVDNVRGQTPHFEEEHLKLADLRSEINSIEGDCVQVMLTGKTRTHAEGYWPIRGFRPGLQATKQSRGYEAELLGRAVFNRQEQRFVDFTLVSVGERWGGTQFNGRSDDLGPSPMGVLFTLAGTSPQEQVAPAYFYAYGWR